MATLIAEDLLLLLTDDETGRTVVDKARLDVGLGGALLVELAMTHRVDLDDRKRLVVLDASPTGDPLLDAALGQLGAKAGGRPSNLVTRLGKGVRQELYGRLERQGVVRREQGKVLGLFPTTSWPAASRDHEQAVRRSLVDLLVVGLVPAERPAALVALLHALRATPKVVVPREHGLSRRELDRRAKALAEGDWGSRAVRQAIDQATAAVSAGVMAATTTATMGS